MSGRAFTIGLRAIVYGALAFGYAALGCGPKGCSCSKLSTNLLLPAPPGKKAFSDVSMVTDGAEPRISLRVARWTGLRYRSLVEASGSMSLEGLPPLQIPAVQTTSLHEVLRGSTDPILMNIDGGSVPAVEERMTIEKVVPRSATDSATLEAWQRLVKPTRGTTLRERISESGGVLSLEAEGGDLPAKEVEQIVKQTRDNQRHFPFRLPPSPIGLGARWRFRDSLDFAGAHTTQIAEMTLKSVSEASAIVGVLLRQEAPPQTIPHPFVLGKVAHLDQFRGDGEGEIEVDRVTGIVRRGRLVGAARLTLTSEDNGQIATASISAMSVITVSAQVLSDDSTTEMDGSDPAGPTAPPALAAPAASE